MKKEQRSLMRHICQAICQILVAGASENRQSYDFENMSFPHSVVPRKHATFLNAKGDTNEIRKSSHIAIQRALTVHDSIARKILDEDGSANHHNYRIDAGHEIDFC